ncbi:MAG: enoyl-CoA hydratase [Pseudooceanicola sp.]|nr:enoyl-CoA hydratase [Pseudooceanicola sp.]
MTTIDTGTDTLKAHVDGHVAVLTMNNPAKRNALSREMGDGMARALDFCETAPEVRVVLLTGAQGAFCAGGDVSSMGEALGGDSDAMVARLRQSQDRVSLRLHTFPKVVIAALPGPAAGAGMSIALACDLRVCAASAFLAPAFGAIGLSGDFGGSWYLTQLIGPGRAKEIYFSSRRIGAEEGQALGLFNRILPDEHFDANAMAYAAEFAQQAPIALGLMKANINRATVTDLPAALDAEAQGMIRTMLTEDHKGAARAFFEKRKPSFQGR